MADLRAQSRLERLAERVVALPPPGPRGRRFARDAGLDAMGCVLAGADQPSAHGARAAHAAYAGDAAIFGTGLRAAAPVAALCNAVAGHALDFDDWDEPGNAHPSVVIFPALWALAQERRAATGRDVSGEAILRAYVAGFEVIARLGEALNFEHYTRGWHTTATFGAPGAAAACAHLLGLNTTQTTHALSLALSQASGYTCQFGSAAKPLQAGFAARDGLTAALLAEASLTGQPGVLDGPRGFAALTAGLGPERFDTVLDSMDDTALDTWGVVLKPYPTCGYTTRLIDCALQLHGRFAPEEVVAIHAEIPDFHYAVLAFDRPTSRAEALFSAPFCIATALLRGGVGLADLQEDARNDPTLWALLSHVEMAPQTPLRPELNYDPEQPDRLQVTLRTGETFEAACATPKGAPQNPMTLEEVTAKFAAIAGPIPSAALEAFARWEAEAAISDLLALFGERP